ncbi:MAG: nitronate monooxygenase [Halioglobus sp.]
MISQLLDIELPIVQAPMAGVQDATLAAAVCNAGGLGSLPCAMSTSESLELEIARLQSLTDRPFNLNFFCHSPDQVTATQQENWLDCLRGYFEELDITPPKPTAGPLRQPFSEESLALLERFKPAVVSFHFGLPRAEWVQQIKHWGIKILSTATTVQEAVWLADNGVDAVIAQGLEAGGHRGSFLTNDMTTQCGTLSLVPQIRTAISLPIIAAGGIAGPEAVAAAFALGSSGVQIGTAFLLCPESRASALHRAALKGDTAGHTALTNVFTGKPARSIVNRLVVEVGPMSANTPPFPYAASAVSVLRQAHEAGGSADFTPLWSGQNTQGCREIPAAQLLRHLATGLEQQLSP